jgi:hypothetical protein
MQLKALEWTECGLCLRQRLIIPKGDNMEGQCAGDSLTNLTEAVVIQDELVQHRLALEWAKTLIDRLLRNWMQLETYEGIAYEDKVRSQVSLVIEAVASLSDLHNTLGRFSQQLKTHQRQLSQIK